MIHTRGRVAGLAVAVLLVAGSGVAVAQSAAAPVSIPCTQDGRTVTCTINPVTVTSTRVSTRTLPPTTTTTTKTVTGPTVTKPGPTTTKTTTVTAPPVTSTVLFEDDFNGPVGQTFDHAKWQDWSACTYNGSAAYGKIKCGDTEALDGAGHLRVPGTPDAGASLSTATKFSFVYGEMSAWIKVPATDGYWPAFWSLNSEPQGESALPVGEVDAVEQYGTWDDLYRRAVHNWNTPDLTWSGAEDPTCGHVDLTTAFHKYTARIEPGRISFFFDGQPCGGAVLKTEGAGKPWAFGPDLLDPNWLILTFAVGGAGGQQNPATEPAEMLVDRVEVIALAGN